MKITKIFKKKHPSATFGKTQKAFKCGKNIMKQIPFEIGKVYKDDSNILEKEFWLCIEVNDQKENALMQQVFGLQ